ncbi:cobalamin B12-binding domain-containing protein [Phosphitispora sp. TUW77]|uniref:cobalamin B12-binding domain-containing protein n=1 Tax=Phosphitispora sp. TUW77 TaxID=3152361 RepID=UPI003AB7093F
MADKKAELWEALKQGVVDYDEDAVREAAQVVIDEGFDAYEAVFEGLVEGMHEVGRLVEEQEYFVPEMLMCADALNAGLDILKPYMKQKEGSGKGTVVIGVVQGDVHDIGKNIVAIMFDAAGFDVHDLGCDVPMDKFVEEQLKTDSELVLISAMMTTTMVDIKHIIAKIKGKNPKCKIMIGGAPISEELASKWGADGFAEDACNALKYALNMIKALKDLK